jgi:hypothetical protein
MITYLKLIGVVFYSFSCFSYACFLGRETGQKLPQWGHPYGIVVVRLMHCMNLDFLYCSTVVASVCKTSRLFQQTIRQIRMQHSIIYNTFSHFFNVTLSMPIPVAAQSKAWVHGPSLAGIVGSNPARGMDVCLLWVLCVVR